jgi:hypothetical protein
MTRADDPERLSMSEEPTGENILNGGDTRDLQVDRDSRSGMRDSPFFAFKAAARPTGPESSCRVRVSGVTGVLLGVPARSVIRGG